MQIQTQSRSEQKQLYYTRSQQECGNCCGGCCSLHCCAVFLMVLWIIGGVISFYFAYLFVHWVEDGEYKSIEPCYDDSGSDYDVCCFGEEKLFGYDGDVVFYGLSCSEVETVYTIQMITAAVQVFAAICGIIGVCAFVVILLLAPLGYCIVSVVLYIYFMFYFEDYVNYILNIVVGCVIVYLFFRNYKIVCIFFLIECII